MKLFVIIACLIAATLAAPKPSESEGNSLRSLPALEHTEVRDSQGQFDVYYRTAEGIEVREKGRLVSTPDGEAKYLEIEGETRYTGPDGQVYVTKYTAGLNGSHMEGSHLPVPVAAESEAAQSAPAISA